MVQEIIKQTQSRFEQIKRIDEQGNEYWSARDMAKVLEYLEFRNFKPVIDKAKEACSNSGQDILNHFVQFHDMVKIGSGAARAIHDVKLSRYACHLIVQNASPDKEVVALGRTFFAVQIRLHEIQQSDTYNGLNTEEGKRLFLRHHIFDLMGSTELAANLFRATQTEDKLRGENVKGKQLANKTYFEVGKKVRKPIQELGGTMPKNLLIADNVKVMRAKVISRSNNDIANASKNCKREKIAHFLN